MKKIRTLSMNRGFAVFLMTVVLWATSCSKGQDNQIVKGSNLSGEQMFREIFLFQGENIAEKIPAYAGIISLINSKGEEAVKDRNLVDDEIVAKIKVTDPKFFDELKQTVESKDLYRIRIMLTKGGNVILKALESDKDYSKVLSRGRLAAKNAKGKYDLSKKSDIEKFGKEVENSVKAESQGDCIALVVAAVVFFAVWEAVAVVNVAAIATVAVEAAAWSVVYSETQVYSASSANTQFGELSNDRIAVSIAENY